MIKLKWIALCLLLLVIIIGCKTDSNQELTIINYNKMVDMLSHQEITIPKDVPYYSLEGELLSVEQRNEFANDLPYADWMINNDSVLVKVQLRDSEKARVTQKNKPLLSNGSSDIDCDDLTYLLQEIYDRDQDARVDNLKMESIDQINLDVVEKILEKCGMPTIENSGDLGPTTIWLVIQHSTPEKRKQYFSMFIEATNNGLLERQDIALMQDRILMDEGREQLYGSQVLMSDDQTYELYDLKEPEKVDSRRKIMGMRPLKEYLVFFNIEFNVPQVD